MKKLLLAALTAAPLLTVQAQSGPNIPGPTFVRDSLDACIRRGMRAWQIPGLAIAIVKDGKVIVSKGYGVREVGKPEPVDENTLFEIASNTKLFTATAVANLSDQEKLRLDDKVTKYLPDFRLYDSVASRLVTIRDVLSHRLGTKTFQGDFTFWNSDLPRAEIVRRLRLLKPNGQFRQEYGYCNAGYLTAGEIVAKVSGQSWEDYVTATMLKPLGMSNTRMLTTGIETLPNVARPYTTGLGKLELLAYDHPDALAPAASMVSSVADMSRWVRMQLDSGRFEGKEILPWPVLQRTRKANTLVRSDRNARLPMHFQAYALGLYTADYNGRQIYWHTGGADGFVTGTCFVPEAGLGMVILTNQDNQAFFETLRYQLLDAYLGVPYVNRSAQALAPTKQGEIEEAQQRTTLALRTEKGRTAKLPRKLDAYCGTWHHPVMGDVTVAADGKRDLKITFPHLPSLTAKLELIDGEQWRLTYSNPAYGQFPMMFAADPQDKLITMTLRVNPFLELDPYTFTR